MEKVYHALHDCFGFWIFSYAIPAYCGCVKLGAIFQAELSQ